MSSAPICINCISGSQLPGTPRGRMETIGPFDTYVSTPSGEREAAQGKAIVSITDVFGLALVNNKIIADLIADRAGITVYVPDIFRGDPLDPESIMMPTSAHEAKNQTWRAKLGMMAKLITVLPWIYRHWPSSKTKDVEGFVVALKQTKGLDRVGSVGYCYGGKLAVGLNEKGIVQATVLCHPSFVNAKSFADLKGPILFNCAEADDIFPIKLMEQVRAMLDNSDTAPEHDFKLFIGTAHGFCARPDLAHEKVKDGFEDATARTADWFQSKL